jgi:3-deoxy-D-manno-octulosonic-acid transferase
MEPYFEMADVVFVGGTFNKNVGGHNILEPISYRKPTLIGPYTDKINDLIEACEAVIQVRNGTELGEKLIELFLNETKCREVSQTCYTAYLKSREGVLESYLALITPIIDRQLSKDK